MTLASGGWRRLWSRLRGHRDRSEDGSAFAFSARLLVTLAVTFALVGAVGYIALERTLAQRQITDYASSQMADAKAFEDVDTRATSMHDELSDIDRLLDGITQRPGTREAMLIDGRHVIRAGAGSAVVGHIDTDPQINAALEHGHTYAGRKSDPRSDRHDFEFVTPMRLGEQRFAYEVTYDHHVYDAQLNEVRLILALIGVMALLGAAPCSISSVDGG